jgi:hypothetical protein
MRLSSRIAAVAVAVVASGVVVSGGVTAQAVSYPVGGSMNAEVLTGGMKGQATVHPARKGPKISVRFAAGTVLATSQATLVVSTVSAPRGSRLKIQRQFGSKHVWRTILTTANASGSFLVPRVALGKYKYRAVLAKKTTRVATSRTITLTSLGWIPLVNLCNVRWDVPDVYVRSFNNCQSYSQQVGDRAFQYLLSSTTSRPPNSTQFVSVGRSSCRKVEVRWGVISDPAFVGTTSTATVVRDDADPQASSAAYGVIGDSTFDLGYGSWILNMSATNSSADVLVNARLLCFTSSGVR